MNILEAARHQIKNIAFYLHNESFESVNDEVRDLVFDVVNWPVDRSLALDVNHTIKDVVKKEVFG